MFDIGFSELLLVGLIALLVLGPERLPGAARTAGLWIGRLKRSFGAIKAEVEREIGADEVRRQLHNEQIMQMEREFKQSILPPATGPAAPPAEAAPDVAEISPSPPASTSTNTSTTSSAPAQPSEASRQP